MAGAWLIARAQAAAGALENAALRRSGWIALALLGGAVLPVHSFLVASAAMALALGGILATGAPRPRVAPLREAPWWGWLGGLCGATYVTAAFSLIPEIGAAPVVVLTVAGQQPASVGMDRYGLLRLPRREISPRRLLGVAILLAGVALITLG